MKKDIRILLISMVCCFVVNMPSNAGVGVKYVDANQFPLYGKVYEDSNPRYNRIPAGLANGLRAPLGNLGTNSSGLAIRFRSNSTSVGVKWINTGNVSMSHMTPTAVRGMDLYCWQNNAWLYVGSAKPTSPDTCQFTLIANMIPEMREYILYLPLYDGIKMLEIGIDGNSEISSPHLDKPNRNKPIVFYGSSIMQGCSASRPGMSITNILSRRLNHEIIDLGFSGNAFLDYEIARMMADVDASVYVMDNIPNSSVTQIHERTCNFVSILRSNHKDVPIVFVEDPMSPQAVFNFKTKSVIEEKNQALRDEYTKLCRSGVKNIYYITSDEITCQGCDGTVDGIHFTDVSFTHYCDVIMPLLSKLLNKNSK